MRLGEGMLSSIGLAATVVVGVGSLVAPLGSGEAPSVPTAWWVAYTVFLGAFLADTDVLRSRPAWLDSRVLALVQVGSALALWFVAPMAGWSSILFVVSAVAAAYALPGAVTMAVVGLQTLAVAVGGAIVGLPTADVVLSTALSSMFQAFAVVIVVSGRREAQARAALAAAHAELRAAAALLAASTRDAERLRISRDLHDVVGHQLTALALELEVASHKSTGGGAEHVDRARTVAKDLLRDVRATVSDLRAEARGLETALREAVGHVPGLAVDLTVQEDARLDQADALVVVRLVQELVTNTVRHADARRLAIRVVTDADGVLLEARDDGRGTARLAMGNGLTGMTERVEHRGGQISFDPGAGRGFGLTARIPVA